jgi:hypothetical protein
MSVRLKYKNQRQLVENDNTKSTFNDPDPRISEEKESELELDYVPDKYLVNVNLNEYLPNFRDKRKAVKNSKEVNYWNHKINEQLKLYNIEQDKYNIKLVKGLCQIVERYMIYDSKLGPQKKQVVLNCCLKFFDNNQKLLEAVIEDQLELIAKSSRFSRLLAKLEIFFFAK